MSSHISAMSGGPWWVCLLSGTAMAQVRGEVEIVFLSCCDDAAAFDTYARKHPWLALPWEVTA